MRDRAAHRLRWVAVSTIVLAHLLGASLPFSGAFFAGQQDSSGNVFDTASVALSSDPGSALLAATGMLPGDTVHGLLTVSNTGTVPLRYAMTTSAGNADGKDLAGALRLAVRSKTADPCEWQGGALISPPSGTVALREATIGDPMPGSQSGDRILAAAGGPGDSEQLCFHLSLPADAGNGYSSASTTATFTFIAEQTGHNP